MDAGAGSASKAGRQDSSLGRGGGAGAPSSGDVRHAIPAAVRGALVCAVAFAAFLGIGASTVMASPPILAIDAPTAVETTKAHLSGEVSVPADGSETYWCFEYTKESAAEWSGFCSSGPVQPGESLPVEVDLAGLHSNRKYEVRLAALDNVEFFEGSEAFSSIEKLKTDPAPVEPIPEESPATDVSYTTATVSGTVDPEGGNQESGGAYVPVHWSLLLSDETADPDGPYEERASGDIISGEGAESSDPLAVGPVELSGLAPGHAYEYVIRVAWAGQERESGTGPGTFTTLAVAKPTISVDPVATFTATSAHLVGHVNPGAPEPEGSTSPAEQAAFETNWHFECVAPGPSCGALSGTAVPAGNAAVQVSADATALQPNTAYYVKLVAANLGGTEEAATAASPSFVTTAVAPDVNAFAAGPVQAEQVSLHGEVNPHNSPTKYWFEWGTANCETSTCTALPASKDAAAGSGSYFVYVSEHLTGLTPNTTYHFLLVAENASGPIAGADQTFTTAAAEPAECPNEARRAESRSGALPDCRAYEMVSPPAKRGIDVIPQTAKTHVATDGDGVTFSSISPFADPKGSALDVEYLARRTGAPGTNGWATQAITPRVGSGTSFSVLTGNNQTYVNAFTPNLDAAVFRAWRPLTDSPKVAEVMNLYRVSGLADGSLTPQLLTDSVAPGPPSQPLIKEVLYRPLFVGASTDLSHVVFQSRLNHTPDAPLSFVCEISQGAACPYRLFENSGGAVHLVGRVPAEPETECDDQDGPACVAAPTSMAGIAPEQKFYTERMVSADGSRILFQTPAGEESGNIYLREDGRRSYQLNVSEAEPSAAPQPARLWEASRDGSRVFFTTSAQLLAADHDSNPDLYMYEVEKPAGERLTLISASSVNDGNLNAVVGASDDGGYVYFVADGQLVPGQPPAAAVGLYLWHDGHLSYIGHFLDPANSGINSPRASWDFASVMKTSRLSPDGRSLLFMTTDDIGLKGRGGFSGYDQAGHRELYLYNADSGRLACASCNPGGDPATADALVNVRENASSSEVTGNLSHALSNDGRFVFFSSAEALLPDDTNDTFDAYSYDSRDGTLHLISSGTDSSPSYFISASADGRDVFFDTRERLSAWDADTSYDLYDTRVGGDVPEPAPAPAPCEGEACLPAPRATPLGPSISSQAARRDGSRPRCRKPKRKVRRHGAVRCVKPKHRHRHHHNAGQGGSR